MRFIHTADWHLGNSLFNIDRTKEFESFLKWLKEEIIKTNADALVIAGDIFDVANPPVNSRKQYNEFLASLLNTTCKNVIVVGGNHDSGALLDSEKNILEFLNIHVVGSLSNISKETLGDVVFEIKDKKQNVIGLCCAIPFARELELRNYYKEQLEPGKLSDYAYKNLYELVCEEAIRKSEGKNIPIIATGHLYASGLEGRLEGQEKESRSDDGRRTIDDVIGNLGSVHVSVFPKKFSYVALGHIHYTSAKAEDIMGRTPEVSRKRRASRPEIIRCECFMARPASFPVLLFFFAFMSYSMQSPTLMNTSPRPKGVSRSSMNTRLPPVPT